MKLLTKYHIGMAIGITFVFIGALWFLSDYRVQSNRPFDRLLDAIEQVESKGLFCAVGDNGKAIGSFQIHDVYLADVNRIAKQNRYTSLDRLSRQTSREIVEIYLVHYCLEHIARTHNGGPNGPKKETTKSYGEKVRREFQKSS